MNFSVKKNGESNWRVTFGRIWICSMSSKRSAEKLASLLEADQDIVAHASLISAYLLGGSDLVQLWHLEAGNIIAEKTRKLSEQEQAVHLLYEHVKFIRGCVEPL